MLKVGLTGGIASGKSIISQQFKNLGVAVYDTDEISHALMQPDQPAYLKTVEHFGNDILNGDLSINRSLLRQIVFNQPGQRLWLEQMIHPMIRERSKDALQQKQPSKYVLLVVPLMFETGFEKLVDYVVAIDCPASVQVSRLIERDGIDRKLADQMMKAQISNEQRLKLSDTSIINKDNQDRTGDVLSLHLQLKQLADKFRTVDD